MSDSAVGHRLEMSALDFEDNSSEVSLYIYDMSKGMARAFSQMFLGMITDQMSFAIALTFTGLPLKAKNSLAFGTRVSSRMTENTSSAHSASKAVMR